MAYESSLDFESCPCSGQVVADGKADFCFCLAFCFLLLSSNSAHLMASKVAVPSRIMAHQSFLSLGLVSVVNINIILLHIGF